MKKLFPIATALLAFGIVGTAYAADLPTTKGPPVYTPPPPPVFSWTGLYVGGNVGWGSIDDHQSTTFCVNPAGVLNGPGCLPVIPGAQVTGGGVLGGAQIGYNYQISNFVLGFETDFQGAELKGSTFLPGSTLIGPDIYTADERIDWLGTARGRVGVAFNQFLVYATGGLAYGRATADSNLTLPLPGIAFPSSTSSTRAGWTAGGGVEWAFAQNWSAKIEGLYYDLGSITAVGAEIPAPLILGVPSTPYLVGKSFNVDGVIVRAGVNYKFDLFGAPAPIVAKY